MFNAVMFFEDAMKHFIPHILIVFSVILYEGLLGGASYVNTFNAVHKNVSCGSLKARLNPIAPL